MSVVVHPDYPDKLMVVMSGFQQRFIYSCQTLDLRMAVMVPLSQCNQHC